MARFLDYYRQFQELSPQELSQDLRTRREEQRRRALAELPALDLATSAWFEPPHPEIVNAATYALRRAVNAYPDPTAAPLRAAIAAAHQIDADRVVVGHGAAELIRAALRALAAGGEAVLAWPGWGPLPRLVAEAGATAVPADPGALRSAIGPATRVVVLSRPADPTGAVVPQRELAALADDLPDGAWLLLDEALAGFLPAGEDAPLEHPRTIRVRSFSKAHAMAGFRIGYALLPADADTDAGAKPPAAAGLDAGAEAPAGAGLDALADALSPVLGPSAPALAGAQWAIESGDAVVARRRAAAARERERLAAGIAGTPISFPAGHGPYVWLSSDAHDGRTLAEQLAASRIFVAPGTAWGDERHVRVTLRDAPATERLAAALHDL